MSSLKHDAEQLVGRLSDEATWDDLIYAIHVHQKVERGLVAAEAGRVISHGEVVRRFSGE
jgi:predicted transcriptional regulator